MTSSEILTTKDIAARLVPLAKSDRQKILKQLSKHKGEVSQLADSFDDDGIWYLHRGDLILDSNYDNTLNLVVEGNLCVRGTLDDYTKDAHLVVLGDLRCQHLFSHYLLVIKGSLYCAGMVYADYNDFAFEVWGPELEARALVLADKSARLPEKRQVNYFYDSDHPQETTQINPGGLAERVLQYLNADDEEISETERKRGAAVARVSPREFEQARQIPRENLEIFNEPLNFQYAEAVNEMHLALLQRDCPPAFIKRALADPIWHYDLALSPAVQSEQLANLGKSSNVSVLTAVASHSKIPVDVIELLASHKAPEVRAAIVHHPQLSVSVAAKLAEDSEADVRRHLAASKLAIPFLDTLVADRSVEVRRAIASHRDLQASHRRQLLQDSERAVKHRALQYLPVTEVWVEELLQSKDEDLTAWAIKHQNQLESSKKSVFAEVTKKLLDPRRLVREAALQQLPNDNIEPAARFFDQNAQKFLKDESPILRRVLAGHSRDSTILATLSEDDDRFVRMTALKNLTISSVVLVAEAKRLCAMPANVWNVYDQTYSEHFFALKNLLEHPLLPTEAIEIIHRVYPTAWRLEPHRNMSLQVILDRALSLEPSLAFDVNYNVWRQAAHQKETDISSIFVAFLNAEDNYLQSAARMNAATPLEALLSHARREESPYNLQEIAQNPSLASKTQIAETIIQLLLDKDEESVAVALAKNPDLLLRVLRKIGEKNDNAKEYARVTAWQHYGESL